MKTLLTTSQISQSICWQIRRISSSRIVMQLNNVNLINSEPLTAHN